MGVAAASVRRIGLQLVVAGNALVTGLETFALIATVFAAVYHAEVVAHRVGEPFGSLVLALAVTIIEVALIVSVMITAAATRPAGWRATRYSPQ